MLLTYIGEEELYNLRGKDRGRILLWMENVSTFDLPCPGMRYVLMLQPRLPPWYCGRSQPLYVRALHPHLSWWHAQERATVSPPGDFRFPSEVLTCRCLQRWPRRRSLPAFSFILATSCRAGSVWAHFVPGPNVQLWIFFLTLSFKTLDFLNEAFESYQHGAF